LRTFTLVQLNPEMFYSKTSFAGYFNISVNDSSIVANFTNSKLIYHIPLQLNFTLVQLNPEMFYSKTSFAGYFNISVYDSSIVANFTNSKLIYHITVTAKHNQIIITLKHVCTIT